LKFNVDRDQLAAALKTAGAAVGRSGEQVALSCILLSVADDKLTVKTTDLSMAITTSIQVDGGDAGQVLVPYSGLMRIVSKLDGGSMSFVTEDNEAVITSGRARMSLAKIEDLSAFPRSEDPVGEAHDIDAATLIAAIGQVAGAAGTDGSRPALSGVYLEGGATINMVATDGYRLAVRKMSSDLIGEGASAIVPATAMAAVAKVCGADGKIAVRIGERAVTFTTPKATLWSRLIDAAYPAYRSILPTESTNTFQVASSRLAAAVDRATLANPSSITLAFEVGKVTVTASGTGTTSEEVEGSLTGDPITVRANPRYLLDGLGVVTGDDVTLGLTDPLKPIKVAGGDADFVYVYMPLRG
jgi:DNA polymerase III subunit beta